MEPLAIQIVNNARGKTPALARIVNRNDHIIDRGHAPQYERPMPEAIGTDGTVSFRRTEWNVHQEHWNARLPASPRVTAALAFISSIRRHRPTTSIGKRSARFHIPTFTCCINEPPRVKLRHVFGRRERRIAERSLDVVLINTVNVIIFIA